MVESVDMEEYLNYEGFIPALQKASSEFAVLAKSMSKAFPAIKLLDGMIEEIEKANQGKLDVVFDRLTVGLYFLGEDMERMSVKFHQMILELHVVRGLIEGSVSVLREETKSGD